MLRNNLNIVSKLAQCQTLLVEPKSLATGSISVRFRWYDPKEVKFRRFGYEDKLEVRGLLPRPMKIRGQEDAELEPHLPGKPYVPRYSWTEKKACFGQNDYIDILGDGDIHPTEIMYKIPAWLRGFRGGEYHMLLRKRGLFGVAMVKGCPDKFTSLQKNIKYEYKQLNRKRRVKFNNYA